MVRPPSATQRQRGSLVACALHGASTRLLDHPCVTSAPTRLRLPGTCRLRFALHTGQIGLAYPGTLIFVSHDREFVTSLGTRIIELTPGGIANFRGNYEAYLQSQAAAA